jgi:hypothetical protein
LLHLAPLGELLAVQSAALLKQFINPPSKSPTFGQGYFGYVDCYNLSTGQIGDEEVVPEHVAADEEF